MASPYPNYPLTLPLQMGDFTPGICFRNEQQRANGLASIGYVTLPSNFSRVIVQPSQPSVEEQSALWVKTDSSNNPIQLFLFSSLLGRWVWPHPWEPGDGRMVLFTGTPGEAALLDGGVAGVPTDATGPFWEIDAEFSDKLPVGAGTIPEGTDENKFAAGAAYPALRGVWFIRRTTRIYLTP